MCPPCFLVFWASLLYNTFHILLQWSFYVSFSPIQLWATYVNRTYHLAYQQVGKIDAKTVVDLKKCLRE